MTSGSSKTPQVVAADQPPKEDRAEDRAEDRGSTKVGAHDVDPVNAPKGSNSTATRPDEQGLPRRVIAQLRTEQNASETLIGWIQLGIVCTFGVLYLIAPKTFTEDSGFEPVPWALASYLAFTLLRLALLYRGSLPRWLLTASIVVDMVLLMALIWTFHRQYEQPPAFYLKAPTLLYVFIFIAIRAIHFEARYVIISGVAAAFGWIVLVSYAAYSAVYVTPNQSMITRDYVEYLTSNTILIGGEFDKLISIITVTIVLAVAINRANRIMIRFVAEETRARDLSRFVPTEVVRQISTSENEVSAGQTEGREATILFVDIEDFTKISETMSPEALVDTLNDYFGVICAPIRQQGGTITQFQGDAVLASFNIPRNDADHAQCAVAAALSIVEQTNHAVFGPTNVALHCRIGINTGYVVGGLVGTEDRIGYTVHGDTVNIAARLEYLNKTLGTRILVSQHTFNALGAVPMKARRFGSYAPNFVDRGLQELRGHREPLRVFSVA